jgi:hydrogenase/urease accessory protein HupE
MIQTMLATLGISSAGHGAGQAHAMQALRTRRIVGFAILTSGLVVIAGQVLQHALGV